MPETKPTQCPDHPDAMTVSVSNDYVVTDFNIDTGKLYCSVCGRELAQWHESEPRH